MNTLTIAIGGFILWAFIVYRIVCVMVLQDKEYTERDDFGKGNWAKTPTETGEFHYLRKKIGFLSNIYCEIALLIAHIA